MRLCMEFIDGQTVKIDCPGYQHATFTNELITMRTVQNYRYADGRVAEWASVEDVHYPLCNIRRWWTE